MQEPVIEFSHISMEFPGVLANDDVSLTVRKGEIFALVGENGAGKSTLMNILYGIHTPTGGSLTVKGRRVAQFHPKASIDLGVGMVHQHFMLVPSFTVTQNIVLGREPRRAGLFYDRLPPGVRWRPCPGNMACGWILTPEWARSAWDCNSGWRF